jgi:hypothetical protein
MELREFVAIALSAILDGVEDAIREAPQGRKGKIAPVIAGEEDWSNPTWTVAPIFVIENGRNARGSSRQTKFVVLNCL